MNQLLKKIAYSGAEVLGMLLFIIVPVIQILGGTVLDDYIFSQVLTIVNLALFLRKYYRVLYYGMLGLIVISLVMYFRYPVDFEKRSYSLLYLVTRLMSGWIIMYYLLYTLINQTFYRNAVLTFPYLLGSGLIVLTILGSRYDQKLASRITQEETQPVTIRAKIRKWPLRSFFIISLGIIMILPAMLPMAGFYAAPPGLPPVYGGKSGPYTVDRIRLEQQVPQNISQYLLPDNNNNSWYTFMYIPQVPQDRKVPVVVFAHGYTGTDPTVYENSLYQLASWGSVVIFVQYVTNVALGGQFTEPANTTFKSSNAMYFRYLMEWNGILQSISELQGGNYLNGGILNLDFVQIIGHSVGGGMVPYLATKIVERGWASSRLIMDMEEPYFAADQPLTGYNLSILPSTTIVTIVGAQDDHLVSPCVGMQFYEDFHQLLPENNTAYLIVPSDFHGFPRLLATHYYVTSALNDALTFWGFVKRADAMSAYLSALANQEATATIVSYFIGNSSTLTGMGKWSDSTPVKPMTYSVDPFGQRGGHNIAQQFINSHDVGPKVCVV